MGLYFKPVGLHADGIAYPVVAVNRKAARNNVQDFAVVRNIDGPRRFQRPFDINRANSPFTPADGDDASAIDGVNVRSSDPNIGAGNFVPGSAFGSLYRLGNGRGDFVDVNHHTFANALGGDIPHTNNPHQIFRRRANFGNERAYFCGANIQGNNSALHLNLLLIGLVVWQTTPFTGGGGYRAFSQIRILIKPVRCKV